MRILSIDEVKKILRVAGEKSQRDALALRLIAFHGFKVHDVVGSPSRRRENNKWGRKGGEGEKRPLKPELVRELRECIGERERGKILDITDSRLLQLTKEYAKDARISDPKKIRPHMFDDFWADLRADQ